MWERWAGLGQFIDNLLGNIDNGTFSKCHSIALQPTTLPSSFCDISIWNQTIFRWNAAIRGDDGGGRRKQGGGRRSADAIGWGWESVHGYLVQYTSRERRAKFSVPCSIHTSHPMQRNQSLCFWLDASRIVENSHKHCRHISTNSHQALS